MRSDPASEIQHVTMRKLLLQPQGVGDVVGTAEMPGCQFEQMARANGVLVEISSSLGVESSRIHRRQILRALGQSLGNVRR